MSIKPLYIRGPPTRFSVMDNEMKSSSLATVRGESTLKAVLGSTLPAVPGGSSVPVVIAGSTLFIFG